MSSPNENPTQSSDENEPTAEIEPGGETAPRMAESTDSITDPTVSSITIDWDDNRGRTVCGIWNCPLDSHLTSSPAANRTECPICWHQTPPAAMLACRQCRQDSC